MNLSVKIIIGLLTGTFLGIFFGEYAEPFHYIGDAFIGLLQMTVLPYIVFSLISNIGKLSLATGKRLILIGLKVLVFLLAYGLVCLLIMPLAFPEWQSGAFFSPSFIEKSVPIDLVSLYIPSNPFQALSANHVPAVVLFSIFVGVGLMNVPGKESVIRALDVINDALNQVNKLIIKLTPIGVAAIAAATVGTVSWEHLGRLQGFLILYIVIVLVSVFWVLPVLISVVTPFKYKDVFRFTRATLLTIFATGKIIIVLPQLIQNINDMFEAEQLDSEESRSTIDILMPLAYPFPNLGSFLIMVFVPFAAWYAGSPLTFSEMPAFLGLSVLSSFIAPVTGLPFMLETMEVSKDMFQLFFVSTVLTDRFRVVLGAMHLIALTVISASIYLNIYKLRVRKFLFWGATSVILIFVSVLGVRSYLTSSLKGTYNYHQLIYQIPERFSHPAIPEIETEARPNPIRLKGWQSKMSRIRTSGVIRVGYVPGYLPFSYRSSSNELIGFDIEMAKLLAESLNVRLTLVPINYDLLSYHILMDHCDIVMSGIPLSSELGENNVVSHSYMDLNLAFLAGVKAKGFETYNKVAALDTFTLGYTSGAKPFVKPATNFFPKMGTVSLDSTIVFITEDTLAADVLLTSAEAGAYQTLLYPEYKVVNPFPEPVTLPLVYVLGDRSEELLSYVNNWIIVSTKQGQVGQLYDHWVLGKQITEPRPNWSIMKDVLGWVE